MGLATEARHTLDDELVSVDARVGTVRQRGGDKRSRRGIGAAADALGRGDNATIVEKAGGADTPRKLVLLSDPRVSTVVW